MVVKVECKILVLKSLVPNTCNRSLSIPAVVKVGSLLHCLIYKLSYNINYTKYSIRLKHLLWFFSNLAQFLRPRTSYPITGKHRIQGLAYLYFSQILRENNDNVQLKEKNYYLMGAGIFSGVFHLCQHWSQFNLHFLQVILVTL